MNQIELKFVIGKDGMKKVSKSNGEPKPDSSFYEKLPFHGLKTPPKKV